MTEPTENANLIKFIQTESAPEWNWSVDCMGLINDFAFIFHLSHIEHKLVMVGLDNAGKTTILYQFLMNEVVHTSPTIGSNVEEIVWKNIHFLVWDLAGELKFEIVYI